MIVPMSNPTLQTLTTTQFELRVQKSDTCWVWQGSKDSGGYGQIWLDHTSNKAHRIAYHLYKGELPKELLVRHKCDNRLCVNPEHLELGTHQDNSQDAVSRGRQTKVFGSVNGNATLSQKARFLIQEAFALKVPAAHVAHRFGVHKSTISRIYQHINKGTFMP